jgi:hypothetical protein
MDIRFIEQSSMRVRGAIILSSLKQLLSYDMVARSFSSTILKPFSFELQRQYVQEL